MTTQQIENNTDVKAIVGTLLRDISNRAMCWRIRLDSTPDEELEERVRAIVETKEGYAEFSRRGYELKINETGRLQIMPPLEEISPQKPFVEFTKLSKERHEKILLALLTGLNEQDIWAEEE
jgi:hypothetical protein